MPEVETITHVPFQDDIYVPSSDQIKFCSPIEDNSSVRKE